MMELKRFLNDGTKKKSTMIALKRLKSFLNDGTKKVLQ